MKQLQYHFKGVIRRAYENTGQKVAILVDEYDKPLLQAFDNKELKEDYRATLKAFYGVEKSMGAYIQFAFFTGVTKFSKVSVFSVLNNLADIICQRNRVRQARTIHEAPRLALCRWRLPDCR